MRICYHSKETKYVRCSYIKLNISYMHQEVIDYLYKNADQNGKICYVDDELIKTRLLPLLNLIRTGDTPFGRNCNSDDICFRLLEDSTTIDKYSRKYLPIKVIYDSVSLFNYRLDVLAKIPKYIKMEILEPTTTFTFYQLYHL